MSNIHHTPIADNAPAVPATFNNPMGQLDQAIEDIDFTYSGEATEFLNGEGNFAVPTGTGNSIDGHVVQEEGVDLTQRAKLNFVGAGVTVTDGASATEVTIPGGASEFLELSDAPAAYTGQAGKAVLVNGTEDGLEFGAVAVDFEVIDDTTPQLGGDLDVNGHNVGGITPTELGHLSGVSANIQDQIDTVTVQLQLLPDDEDLIVEDGIAGARFIVPAKLNGWNLTSAHAFVTTVSSSGTPTVQIHNVTDGVDLLTTRITIDANEKSSRTAAAAPVIDTTHDDIATDDELRFDCDAAGTGTMGLIITLVFAKP